MSHLVSRNLTCGRIARVVCPLLWLTAAGPDRSVLAAGFLGGGGYWDNFEGGPILPWTSSFGTLSGANSDGILFDEKWLRTPLLPVAVPAEEVVYLRIGVSVGGVHSRVGIEDTDLPVRVFRGNSSDAILDFVIPYPLNEPSVAEPADPDDVFIWFESAIPVSSVGSLGGCCLGEGLRIEFYDPLGMYGPGLEIGEVFLEWSEKPPITAVSWSGEQAIGTDSGWDLDSEGGYWRLDSLVGGSEYLFAASEYPVEDPNGPVRVIVEAVTPPLRFLDLSTAEFLMDIDLAWSDGDKQADGISIDLETIAGQPVASIASVSTVQFTGFEDASMGYVGGQIRLNFLKDVFNEFLPSSHVDGETVYRIRTRVFDSDDFRYSSYYGFGSLTVTNAVVDDAGDYNQDGVVDAADYTIWRDAAAGVRLGGDGDGNGAVDAVDYSIWEASYGVLGVGPVLLSRHTVPEPSAMFQLVLLVVSARSTRFRAHFAPLGPDGPASAFTAWFTQCGSRR
ncbi:hypothetical protein [Botrimarina sp.]|uniref:hypothetical protein n=1 Tax=Botrimarina sp. TaxID=2795802 RepID=UPI0032EFB34C